MSTPQQLLGALPIPAELRDELDAAIQRLCVYGARLLSSGTLDPATATTAEAQQGVLDQATVAEALAAIVAERQQRLALLAKGVGITDRRMGEACGITEQGAAQRRKRASTQQA